MEMALRAQTPLCSRSRPMLVRWPRPWPRADYPKRNPRRSSTPKPKGTASRGYAPRPAAESSTKKIEQGSTHEDGDLGRSNGTLSSEATEQTSTAEEESELEFSGNVSSSAELEGVVNEAETEEDVDQRQPPALASTSMDVESVNEATEQTNTADESSEVDFSGNVSSTEALEGVDEAEAEQVVDQKQSSALTSTSMDVDSIDRELEEYRSRINALVGSKPEPSSLASTQET